MPILISVSECVVYWCLVFTFLCLFIASLLCVPCVYGLLVFFGGEVLVHLVFTTAYHIWCSSIQLFSLFIALSCVGGGSERTGVKFGAHVLPLKP